MYQAIRDKNGSFSGCWRESGVDLNVGYGGESEQLYGELVSGNYFTLLACSPGWGSSLQMTTIAYPAGIPWPC